MVAGLLSSCAPLQWTSVFAHVRRRLRLCSHPYVLDTNLDLDFDLALDHQRDPTHGSTSFKRPIHPAPLITRTIQNSVVRGAFKEDAYRCWRWF